MSSDTIRSTCYLDPALHRAPRLKAAGTHRTMSGILNDAIRAVLCQDEQDLAPFAERVGEKTLSYEELLEKLKADGAL
jgi:hypothetical protein